MLSSSEEAVMIRCCHADDVAFCGACAQSSGFNAWGSTGSKARPTCALDVAPTSPSRFETTCGRANSWRQRVRAPETGPHPALTSSRAVRVDLQDDGVRPCRHCPDREADRLADLL